MLAWLACAGVRASSAAAPDGLSLQALAPRSGPRGKTLFARLPSEQTGIVVNNAYDDPAMWGERYQEFVYGAIGTGIAIGDYDGDGRPDVCVVTKVHGVHLFRNLGNWKFEDVTEKAGLTSPEASWTDAAKRWFGLGSSATAASTVWNQGVTFVDINNDGLLDLFICRFGAPNLLYINQGQGTFREEAAKRGLAIVDACGSAAFCDYDRDGWLDVYIQTNLLDAAAHPIGQRDYLFHNNGDGTFTNVTDRAGIVGETQGHSAIWWDYDGDGWPDLYVANDFAVPDSLYHNNHDGTFTNVIDRVIPHTPHSSMGSDLGDVNNDGRIDYLVADMAATSHEKDQRGMAKIRVLLDRAEEKADVAPQYMRSALYINTGTGYMLEAARLAGLEATDWTWSVRLEDLDNDGRVDAFFTNGMVRELHNADLEQRISASESMADRVRGMKESPVFAESHLAFRNLGDLQFENVSAAWGLNDRAVSFGAAFGDLDGDGDLDLVYINYDDGVTVMRNDSDSAHRAIVALHGTRSNRFGVGATVRLESALGVQVRTLVLTRGYLSNSEPVLQFGLGNDTTIRRLTVEWPSGATQTFSDLPADRRFTITEPADSRASPAPVPAPEGLYSNVSEEIHFSVLARDRPFEPTRQQPLLMIRPDRLGPALAVGNVNDGPAMGVVLGGTTADPARLFLAQNAGGAWHQATFSIARDATLPDGPVLLFDARGTGHDDLLMTTSGAALPTGPAYRSQLFVNDGQGHFQPAPDGTWPNFSASVGAAIAGDFDRNGRLDVFLGARLLPGKYPLSPRSALFANRGGRFEDVTDSVAPALRAVGMVTSALWTDVDGDGWLDLLVAVEWGNVKYFHNDHGQRLEDWTARAGFAAAGTGWWTSLAAGDFNHDGRTDYVAGNVGLNTSYRASPEAPALLYYGAFAPNAAPLLIEAYEENGRIFPWRTRSELGARLPAVLKKFPRNDDYARATLGQILGDDRLAAAQKFSATEFRSGVFLSQPDGTFRFEPLPRIAQIGPLQGIAVGDFDGDGQLDIYAVQNEFAPLPSVGRFDGGVSQLLRGDGQGHFAPVEPAESRLIVPGDAKALAVLDFDGDGWPDFLVTRNNDTTLAFRHRGVPGRRPVGLRLVGPRGNPSGIGGRVSLVWDDGEVQTAEVYAGGGYWSQSAPEVFFNYDPRRPPQRIRVRWPSGNVSEQSFDPARPHLTVVSPGG